MKAWLIKGLALLAVGVLALAGSWWAWNTDLGLLWSYLGVLLAGVTFFMSLKAFLRAFVEGWRSRLSKRVGVEVAADKDTCLPGDAVSVSVKVTGKEELDIEEGRVALVCVKCYVDHYQELDGEYRTRQVTDEDAEADERILEKKTPPAGERLRARGRLPGAFLCRAEQERFPPERRMEDPVNPRPPQGA